ncbi:hypothetical protein TWF970_010759 [Orbilia oligospora]|uniref:Protein kinase domain-containing protein n=1 Tax=Orbilia oligospora TaxID=2813651 RepID=A0A7C8UZA9_ORBOL|nr:hypothetical protein TWF970_010759 [Orbilia oligospora]
MDNHRDRNVSRPVTTWMASPSSLTQSQKAKPFAPLPVIAEATTSRHNTAIDRNQTNRKPYTNVEIHNIPPIQDQPSQPSIPVTVSSIWQHYLRICIIPHWNKWYLALHNQEMNLVLVRKITASSFHAIQDLPAIRHENIATFEIIFESLVPSSREYYIAAEYMELTLQHLIDSVFDLEESEIATIIREILDARSFLQINGLDHCDITPSRVFISASTGSVKIGDPFAIKKIDTKNRQDAQSGTRFTTLILEMMQHGSSSFDNQQPVIKEQERWSSDLKNFLSISSTASPAEMLKSQYITRYRHIKTGTLLRIALLVMYATYRPYELLS